MKNVYIYWDNSNIFISAQSLAEEREGFSARFRVRIHFEHLYRLAAADREVARAYAAGSIPPELTQLWNRLRQTGTKVDLFERGAGSGKEWGVDAVLQTEMFRDGLDNNGNPGIIVLLTGDGRGFHDGVGFHADIERLNNRGWGIEVLAWEHSCNHAMKKWAEANGVFIPLDDHYMSITYLEPNMAPDRLEHPRQQEAVDITRRKMVEPLRRHGESVDVERVRAEAWRETAIAMIRMNMDNQLIASITTLPTTEIERLRKTYNGDINT